MTETSNTNNARELILEDLFSAFHTQNTYLKAKDFRVKHRDKIHEINALVKEDILREDNGVYIFHLAPYIQSTWWKQEEKNLDIVFGILKSYYIRDTEGEHKSNEIISDALTFHNMRFFPDEIDRAIILLNRMLFISGGSMNPEQPWKYLSFRIREDVICYNNIAERIAAGVRNGDYPFTLPSIKPHKTSGLPTSFVPRVMTFSDYALHAGILTVSQKLFIDGHYPQAVEMALKKVIATVKECLTDEERRGADGDAMMNLAFGSEGRVPHIRFNPCSNQAEKDEQKGIMFLFKGIVAIRNRKAHDFVKLDNPTRAFEYLCLSSMLIRLLEATDKFKTMKDTGKP